MMKLICYIWSVIYGNMALWIKKEQCLVFVHITTVLCSDLEILQQASARDFAAVDLLHIDVTRTEEPGDQDLQVVYKLTINL